MRCDALRAVSCAPGESRAEVGRKSGSGPDPVVVPHRSLRGHPLRRKGPPGRFCGFGGDLGGRVCFFCGFFSGSGIRVLSCGRLCSGVCFSVSSSAAPASALCPARVFAAACALPQPSLRYVPPAFSPFCVSCFAVRPCNEARMPPSSLLAARVCAAFLASTARLSASHRRPASCLALETRLPASLLWPVSLQLRSADGTARSGSVHRPVRSAHRPCGGALRPPARHRGLAEPFPARRPVRIVGNNP